jgi:sugar-specific transcriptional regulator TrmB/DNA-binding CsgD family transcriptional regulator
MDETLTALGLSELEEAVYRALLVAPGRSLSSIAEALEAGRERCRRSLTILESRGLISRGPQGDPRFFPAPPGLAIEALIRAKEEELQRTRLAARELDQAFAEQGRSGQERRVVEILTGREAILQRFEQLQLTADQFLRVFDKPPHATLAPNVVQQQPLAAGVRYLSVYEAASLELPGRLEIVKQYVRWGEEARVVSGVPMKLAIADSDLALVPLSIEEPGIEESLLIHESPLLDALVMLFDRIWQEAAPIRLENENVETPLTETDQLILTLLGSGLQDQAIARQTSLGLRTIRRHVSSLLVRLHASSRFQAGVIAAKRDWV